MKIKLIPPTYFFVLLLLSIGLHFVAPTKYIIPTPYNYIGIVFILFGIIIIMWTGRLFRSNNTTVKPLGNPTFLITSGPYKISRNPIYLGTTSVLFGTAILLKSIIAFISPVAFIIIIEILFIRGEENKLIKQFGEEYINYKKRTRRWI